MIDLTKKRVVVTGGSGFLGRHVAAALERRGCREIVTPRKAQYDLTHEPDVRRLFADVASDIVIHLAAVVGGIGANRESPGRFFYENVMMGAMTMEHARLAGVEKFVGIGTICAYPKLAPVPFLERDLWNGYPEEVPQVRHRHEADGDDDQRGQDTAHHRDPQKGHDQRKPRQRHPIPSQPPGEARQHETRKAADRVGEDQRNRQLVDEGAPAVEEHEHARHHHRRHRVHREEPDPAAGAAPAAGVSEQPQRAAVRHGGHDTTAASRATPRSPRRCAGSRRARGESPLAAP